MLTLGDERHGTRTRPKLRLRVVEGGGAKCANEVDESRKETFRSIGQLGRTVTDPIVQRFGWLIWEGGLATPARGWAASPDEEGGH